MPIAPWLVKPNSTLPNRAACRSPKFLELRRLAPTISHIARLHQPFRAFHPTKFVSSLSRSGSVTTGAVACHERRTTGTQPPRPVRGRRALDTNHSYRDPLPPSVPQLPRDALKSKVTLQECHSREDGLVEARGHEGVYGSRVP